MVWGAYVQTGLTEELDMLGSELSLTLHCQVHYPAFNKPVFECMCGVIFPLYLVRGRNWKGMRQKHDEERKLLGKGG